jgi:hypothetical protein
MSPSEYRKLPGGFRGFFRRHTLWLGPDHLLLVDSTRFSETYKRFYLPDIQTIVIRKTPRFVLPYYWVVLAIAALITLLAGWSPSRQVLFWPAAAILGGVGLYLYVASMFQSCTCHLMTRVSNVELSSLFRLRAAMRFVDLIGPRIVAVQGQLPEGWVERTTTLAELSTAADRNPDTLVDLLPGGTFSWIVVFVFVFVLLDAGMTWLQLHPPAPVPLSVTNVMNMIALAVCGTISIVSLSRGKTRHKGGPALRMLVLAALFVVAAVTYGAVLLQSFDQQFFHRTFQDVLDYPGMRTLAIGEIVLDLVVAIPGLILAFRQPQAPPKPTSLFTGAPPA